MFINKNMQLDDLITKSRDRLGTSVTSRFDDAVVTAALNDAAKRLQLEFDIKNKYTSAILSFTSGSVAIPSDYVASSQEELFSDINSPYKKVDERRFLDNEDKTYKVGTSTINIYPASTTSLTFFYAQEIGEMSENTDDSGLPKELDEAHALLACQIMLEDNRQYDAAQVFENRYRERMRSLRHRIKQRYGSAQQSDFSRALKGTFGLRSHSVTV